MTTTTFTGSTPRSSESSTASSRLTHSERLADFPASLPEGWRHALAELREKPSFTELLAFLRKQEQSRREILPAAPNLFRALESLDLPDVNVLILGQDPYPTPGHAIGLCFAVPSDVSPRPPSLLNLFKEIASDLDVQIDPRKHPSELTGWVRQGVLLLNTVLTVEAGKPLSHRGHGWEELTDGVIGALNARMRPVIFLFWGAAAQRKRALVTAGHHYVLEAAHPSPLSASRGFFGCRHFSQVNSILEDDLGRAPIDWTRTG